MNSSDWIADAAAGSNPPVPDWIAALGAPGEFSDVSPFARSQPAAGAAPPAPATTPANAQSGPPLTEWDRGFAAGEAAARSAAEAEISAADSQRMALRLAFRDLDQAAMDALAGELAQTVTALCDAALEDHAADPDAVLRRARAAAKRLGSAAGSCTLHLHPDDIETLGDGALSDWEVVPDPALERGSIEFSGPEGGVRDGPSEWRRAITAALRG